MLVASSSFSEVSSVKYVGGWWSEVYNNSRQLSWRWWLSVPYICKSSTMRHSLCSSEIFSTFLWRLSVFLMVSACFSMSYIWHANMMLVLIVSACFSMSYIWHAHMMLVLNAHCFRLLLDVLYLSTISPLSSWIQGEQLGADTPPFAMFSSIVSSLIC